MSGTTTNFLWPFPTGGDAAQVASDVQSLASAQDGTLGNAWTAYAPSWTSTGVAPVVGNGTLVGRFKLFGKWGLARITLTAGGTTTFGTLLYRWSLPPGWTLVDTTSIYGIGSIFDSSTTTQFTGAVWAASTTTVAIRTHSATTDASQTVPMTAASGDIWQLLMLVELA